MRTMVLVALVSFVGACGGDAGGPAPIPAVSTRCTAIISTVTNCDTSDAAGLAVLACGCVQAGLVECTDGVGGPVEGCITTAAIVPAQGEAPVMQYAHCVATCPAP